MNTRNHHDEWTTFDVVDAKWLEFEPTSIEHNEFSIAMPESWSEGAITFKPVWKHPEQWCPPC